ncbi:hypothetical protein [Treponema putidum]|nr:hypothetical protein [Treponema putidum]
MPKYFSFKVAGYYLYFTSKCIIKERYIEMYEKWCEYSHENFYTGK